MAQVEKNENFKELKTKNEKAPKTLKNEKKETKKKEVSKKEKKSIKDRLLSFAHGVKQETKRIHWPTKKEMFRYSTATIVFVIFFALVHSLIG